MLITNAILPPIRPPIPLLHRHQIPHVDIEIHLHIHADAPIEQRPRAIHIDVRDSGLDDLGELLAGFFVRRDADFGLVAGVGVELEAGGDGAGELEGAGLADFVEGVDFAGVFVGHGDAGFAGEGGLFGALGVDEGFVEELVEGAVLVLWSGESLVKYGCESRGWRLTSVMELSKAIRIFGSVWLITHSFITGSCSRSLVFLSISRPILASISSTAPRPRPPPAGATPTSLFKTTLGNRKSATILITSSAGIVSVTLCSQGPKGPLFGGGGWIVDAVAPLAGDG